MHNVLLVDDHAVVREGLRALLRTDRTLRIVGEAESGEEACARAAVLQPDVVIMDVSLPGMNGAESTRRLLQVSPASRVIALTAHDEPAYVRDLLDAGASGFVLKRSVLPQLTRAIEAVARGAVFLDPNLVQPVPSSPETPTWDVSACLTSREVDVASLIARGHTQAEIARVLEISVKTVETHKTRLMTKLGLRTRAQLVRYAVYRRWLT